MCVCVHMFCSAVGYTAARVSLKIINSAILNPSEPLGKKIDELSVLSRFLSSVFYIYDCTPSHPSGAVITFADHTVVAVKKNKITNDGGSACRDKADRLIGWASENNQSLMSV